MKGYFPRTSRRAASHPLDGVPGTKVGVLDAQWGCEPPVAAPLGMAPPSTAPSASTRAVCRCGVGLWSAHRWHLPRVGAMFKQMLESGDRVVLARRED